MSKPMRVSELTKKLEVIESRFWILLSLNLATLGAVIAMLLGYL